MTDIYIVRHGNTFDAGDVVTRVGARTDLPLSSSGQAQAEALARHFQTTAPAGFGAAYCSPLLRTRQTAEEILERQDPPLTIETLEFLREVDYGPDENQPEDLVVARIGEAALQAWEERAVPPPGWKVDPVGLRQAWRDLFEDLASLPLTLPILIVTSNGIARFLLETITAFEIEPASIKLKTGAYGHVRVRPGEASLMEWNVRP